MYRSISLLLLVLALGGCQQPKRDAETESAKRSRFQPLVVEETRLLGKSDDLVSWGLYDADKFRGSLGSELFVYALDNQPQGTGELYRIEGDKVVPLGLEITSGEIIWVHLSKDDSRIVFATRGATGHSPSIIYSVKANGSDLIRLVESEGTCGERANEILNGDGGPYCNSPGYPRLSPDGRKVLFIDYVLEIDEERQTVEQPNYLSVVPTDGGPVVRLVRESNIKLGRIGRAEWSECGRSIYYVARSRLWRFDLDTGRSQPVPDNFWEVIWQLPLRVSPADGSVYFVSDRGFTRLDPRTGSVEVLYGRLDAFELSPDGSKIVGTTEQDEGSPTSLTIIDLENRYTYPLEMRHGTKDELGLEVVLAGRSSKRTPTSAKTARQRNIDAAWVESIHWLDETRLWCMLVLDGRSRYEHRVGIIELGN